MPTDPYTQLTADIDNCDWYDRQSKLDLIVNRHTPVVFWETVMEEHFQAGNDFAFFANFFPTTPWQWGKTDLITETYHSPVLPFDWSRFRRMYNNTYDNGAVNDNDISGCIRCREILPTGGYSRDHVEFFQGGLRTEPYCVDKIKGERDFWEWESRMVRDMLKQSTEMVNQFAIYSVFQTTGHKILLEEGHSAASSNVYPLLDEYPNNYRAEKFHGSEDPDQIVPFDLGAAEAWAQDMIDSRNYSGATKTADGTYVYNIWTSGDWHKANILSDPEYAKSLLHTEPAKLFRGYSLEDDGSMVKAYGNILPRTMPSIPRFADNADGGGIIPVQVHAEVDVEIGTKPIKNKDHNDAPYELILAPSPNQAAWLKPDPITTSQGIPIPNPLYGNRSWYAWNEYDKDCNPEKNMPEWRFDFDMGIMPKMRDEGTAFLARRQMFRRKPQNLCQVYPRISVSNVEADCVSGDRAAHAHDKVDTSVTDANVADERILITQASSGHDDTLIWLKVKPESQRPGFTIPASAGDEVKFTYDDGTEAVAVLVDDTRANPNNLYLFQLLDASGGSPDTFPTARYVTHISYFDATPTVANILSGEDTGAGEITVVLDSPLNCLTGDVTTVVWKTAAGATTNTDATVTIGAVDDQTLTYVLTGAAHTFNDGSGEAATVTCN